MEKEKLDRDRFGQLKWAIIHGQTKIVESLLDENAPVNDRRITRMDFRPPLHSSVYLGDLEIVRKLLDRGALINVFNVNNETALMLAAKFEKYDIVDLLLSDKRLKNCANRENFTHLHIACMRNRVDATKRLLEHRTDVNTAVKSDAIRWSGYTPLHFAVEFKSIETVAFLLKVGADITIQDSKQFTPLHLADWKRNDQIIDMILVAHKHFPKNPANSEGLSHFHIACTRNDKEIVEFFIKNGVILRKGVDEKSLDWPEFTALDFAIYYDRVDIVRLLLEKGNHKMFPLKETVGGPRDRVENAHRTGNSELANLVLHRGKLKKNEAGRIERPHVLPHSRNYQISPIVKDSFSKMPNVPNAKKWQGNTPLHRAVERGNWRTITNLLDEGADYNIKNVDGKSPLHLAFERNMKNTERFFVDYLDGIQGNPADNDGFSHLHIACIEDNKWAVAKFIELGVDVNAAVNNDSVFWPGFTSLHFAMKFESTSVVRYLLENGASYSLANADGQTAFDMTISRLQHIEQGDARQILDLMRVILSHHQKVGDDSFSDRGFSLLHIAQLDSAIDMKDMREFIQEHQGDINKAVHTLGSPWDGYTPLHFAMLNGEQEKAKLLVEFGADISSKSVDGDYPYHLALYNFDIPQVPVSFLDFEKMQHNPVGSNGHSMFHVACAVGNMEWIKYFLDRGIDPNMKTISHGFEFNSKTPLHCATGCRGGSKLGVVELLLESGADATLRDDHLNTALHNMVGYVESEVIDLLVDHGVDVNSRNVSLETPLLGMYANASWFSDKQLSENIQNLLDCGADINLEDESGGNPLSLYTTWRRRLQKYPLCAVVLTKHVMKLKVMGAFISRIIDWANSEFSHFVAIPMRSRVIDFPDQCKKELELLKGVHLNISTSLHDALYKNFHGLYVMSENDEFRRIINSKDFEQKYPIYGPMLKLQLRKGKERRQLMTDAEKSLQSLTRISLPRDCSERIFQYNTNEDLKNIIMSCN